MELRQLRHFLVLAEELHFGRAAARVHLTQPALSASISKLEDEIAVRLFERDRKNVRITLAGRLMLEHAREQINHADRTRSFARALSDGKAGRISVGFTPAVLTPALDGVIGACRSAHPDIEVLMVENTGQRQIEQLRAGELDAGLVGFSVPPARLEHIELQEDRWMACIPGNHPLARAKIISLTELRDEPFVMLARDRSPGYHDMVIGMCVASGFHPAIAYQTDHTFTTLNLVGRGLGVTIALEELTYTGFANVAYVPMKQEMSRWCGYFVWDAKRFAPGLLHMVDAFRRYAEGARRGAPGTGIRRTRAS